MDVIIQQCRPPNTNAFLELFEELKNLVILNMYFATQCSFWFIIKLVVILCSYYVIRSSRNKWKKPKFIKFKKSYNESMNGFHAIWLIQKYIENWHLKLL